MWPSSMFVLVSLLPLAAAQVGGKQNQEAPIPSGPTTNQDRVVDYEYCYEALNRHDSDFNGRITKSEFLGFCQDFGGNTECLADLAELPIELQAVWNEITCECVHRGGADDCCVGSNANIPINGVRSSDTTTIEQQQFLRQGCLRTDQAIIAYCGPPPIPPVIGPPGGFVLPTSTEPPITTQEIIIISAIAAGLLLLLCCCRRRWLLCPNKKEELDSDEEREVDAVDPEESPSSTPDDGYGSADDADAKHHKVRTGKFEEENELGRTRYGRMVENPEHDIEEMQKKFKIEQFEKPKKTKDSMNLNPVHRPPPPKVEEEPYDLEHYTPDGGIIGYDRTGKFVYNADGGVAPVIRVEKKKVEPYNSSYTRKEKELLEAADNRRKRMLSGYDGSAIFAELAKVPASYASKFAGMPDWVVLESLNTLAENEPRMVEASDEEGWDNLTNS